VTARRLAVLAACAAIAVLSPRPSSAEPPLRILVVPFENVARDARIFWLTEASAVLLAEDLNMLGASAITRGERHQAFEKLQVPPAAALTDATVIRIGQLVGAAQVVVGSLQLDGESVVVRARDIALDTGRIAVDVSDRGELTDLFKIFERIARRIAPPSPKTTEEVESRHPPLDVFEDYIKGLLAETPATAIKYLTTALSGDPSFDPARLALWDVYADQGDHEHALAAVLRVPADSPVAREARFRAGLSQLQLKKYDDAFATFKALLEASPTSTTVMNNLGIVQLRRGAAPQAGQGSAAYYFNKAKDTDADDPDYIFNLGYAAWLDHDTQAAIYWLREAVRRNPADADAHFVLGAALAAGGDAAGSSRERDLARRLSSAYEPARRGEGVPKGLERVKNEVELPHARIEARLASSEQRDQEELATFYLDRGRRLYQDEQDRDAIVELNRATYLSPYRAEAHLLLGRIYLRNGRVQDAIGALKIALWSQETAETHAALGEAYRQGKDLTAARAEAQLALALDPNLAEAKQLLARLDVRE